MSILFEQFQNSSAFDTDHQNIGQFPSIPPSALIELNLIVKVIFNPMLSFIFLIQCFCLEKSSRKSCNEGCWQKFQMYTFLITCEKANVEFHIYFK